MSKFEKFKVREVHRSKIQNAPYNPRVISDKALAKLKKNIKTQGLLTTLVWNETSGNLVSGHQRLKVLDALEKTDDYTLTVAVVNLDEKSEKEQNLFFNNMSAQGEFDFDLLLDILPDIDSFAAGFDLADLNIIGYDVAAEALISDEQAEAEGDIMDMYATNTDAVKNRKQEIMDGAANRMDEGERYFSIVFDSYAAKAAYLKSIGLSPDDLHVTYKIFNMATKGR